MFAWLIQQIIGDLPSWLWPAIAGGGFAIYFFSGVLSHFPQIKPYTFLLRPAGLALTIFGIFMYGGAGVSAIYREQIQEMEAKMAVAQQASKDTNVLVKQKHQQKVKVIHDTKIVVQKEIQTVEKRIDAECKLDPAVVKIINEAAKNPNTTKGTVSVEVTGDKK